MRLFTILRFALRDLRGGLGGLRVLIACVALGVFAIVAVNTLAGSLQRAISEEGRMLLGGDVSFSRMSRDLQPDEQKYLENLGSVSTIVTLRAMARDTSGEAALVEVKAVPEDWPRLGTVALSPEQSVADALGKRDGVDGAAVEQALLDRLAIKVGDRISIGDAQFVIRAVLVSEPDRLAFGVGFGSHVLVSRAALAVSGLTGQDSLVRFTSRVALAARRGGRARPAKGASTIRSPNFRMRRGRRARATTCPPISPRASNASPNI